MKMSTTPWLLAGCSFALTLSSHAITDANNNGISDVWEWKYPAAMANLAADVDRDGKTARQEGEQGTNPFDNKDFFGQAKMLRSADGSAITLTWRSLDGRYYDIEESVDLANWSSTNTYPIGSPGISTTETFSPALAVKKFFRVTPYEYSGSFYEYSSDSDPLLDWEERLIGTDPLNPDTDGDGLPDNWEFANQLNPLSAADGLTDLDADGLSNFWEYKLKLNLRAYDTGNTGISDGQKDPDEDGLTNLAEITATTDPSQPDTDSDGLSDGWEIKYGFPALIKNETDGIPANDPSADPDNDSLINSLEDQLGTNPNNADTDGDGFSDRVEEESGSNSVGSGAGFSTPANPGGTPGGPIIPPPPIIPVQVNFGDHSGSHSEKYKVTLKPLEGDTNNKERYRTNRKYGVTQTETFHLPAGAKYKITLSHIGTDPQYQGPPYPDYDYTLEFTSGSTDSAIQAIPEDTAGMLGVHDESEEFFASGKEAKLNIAWLTSQAFSSIPLNRARKKLGVGENLYVGLKPEGMPVPTWMLTGVPGTSALPPLTSGAPQKFIAGKRACTPSVEATLLGTTLKLDFNVVEPTGETAEKIAETSPDFPLVLGMQGAVMVLSVTTLPNDVSFRYIEVLEIDKGTSNIQGFFAGVSAAELKHNPNSAWVQLSEQNKHSDTAGFGGFGPPSAWAFGTYQWAIDLRWRVKGVETGAEQGVLLGTRIQAHELINGTGKSIETKVMMTTGSTSTATRTP